MRFLQCAHLARTRSDSLLRAEQLELHAVRHHGGGVQHHERTFGARRFRVHDARGELLAAAGRSGDQHAAIGGRHLVDRLAKLIDGGRAADHLEGIAAPLAQFAVLALQPRGFQRAGGEQHQTIGLEWLLDIVVGAALDCGDRSLDVAVAADDDDGEVGMRLLDAVEQLEPIELGALQPNVENHERRPPLLDGLQGLVAVLGEPRRMAFIFQDARDQFPDIGFVVDDQNIRRHGLLPLPRRRVRCCPLQPVFPAPSRLPPLCLRPSDRCAPRRLPSCRSASAHRRA